MAGKSKKRTSEAAADDYDSDGGFVVDEDGGNGSKAKKVKSKHSKAESSSIKGADMEIPGDGGIDDDGSEFWELSGKRRVTISEFPKGKGKFAVNIREYYEKEGKMLPGKKGILMPLEQFNALIDLLPHIETVFKKKGVELPRPCYNILPGEKDAKGGDGPAEEEPKNQLIKNENGASKKNFEATSEEDEGAEGER
ncbi:MAG: hypothetical protein M1836_000318 [Candelina mexicana]|nr:MAG: hypothetical protein M1836_000318 [Candelina mexicana]